MKNNKIVTVYGERNLNVSNLSSFSYSEPEEVSKARFKAPSGSNKNHSKEGMSISSYKDALQAMESKDTKGWGQVLVPIDNKAREGLGFSPIIVRPAKKDNDIRPIQDFFRSRGFLHPISQEVHTVEENDSDSSDEE